MALNRTEFFALLDGLTEKEIEARLPTWDMERLELAQEYVETRLAPADGHQRDPRQTEKAAETAALLALNTVRSASVRATAALILSIGAMITSVLCGVILVLK